MTEPTLAAVVTPPGAGGNAVIRVSGSMSYELIGRFFQGKRKPQAGERIFYGVLRESPEQPPLDEVLLTLYTASCSPTGEELVEINCHGGECTAKAILTLLAGQGVSVVEGHRLLEQAQQHGLLDSLALEALSPLWQARTELASRVFLYQVQGALRAEIDQIAALVSTSPSQAAQRLTQLLNTARFGRALSTPERVVIVGRPNAGKSTLFNVLVGKERAMVDPTPGTTRDAILVTICLQGIPWQIVDTAGLRPAEETVEILGIELTRRWLKQAEIILWLLDVGQPPEEETADPPVGKSSAQIIPVLNKIDCLSPYLPRYQQQFPNAVAISALLRQIDPLRKALVSPFARFLTLTSPFAVLFTAAQEEAARQALESLQNGDRHLTQLLRQLPHSFA